MLPAIVDSPARTASRLLGTLAAAAAAVAAGTILLPEPLADVFFAGWVLAAVGLAAVGGVAAWTDRTALVWLTALLLSGLAVLGMWSIGTYVAPAALFLLGAAVCSQLAGPRVADRVAPGLEPAAVPASAPRTLAGAGAIAAGGWLAYAGAVERGLFGACARETLACALAVARWEAIGLTGLGLALVAVGGWMCYRQLRLARAVGWKPVR